MSKKAGIFIGIIISIILIGGVVTSIVIFNKLNDVNVEISDLKEEIRNNNKTSKKQSNKDEKEEYSDNSFDDPLDDGNDINLEDSDNSFSNLKEIRIDELKRMINNEESFILVISQTTCSHCVAFKPVINDTLKKYNLSAYYIERDLLTEEELEELNNIATVIGTPTTVFIANGVEQSTASRINGNRDESEIESKLKEWGYI